jgi:hypothetical protein
MGGGGPLGDGQTWNQLAKVARLRASAWRRRLLVNESIGESRQITCMRKATSPVC